MFCTASATVFWIIMTLCAVLRIGIGDARGSEAFDAKENLTKIGGVGGVIIFLVDIVWGSWNYIHYAGGSDHILACSGDIKICDAMFEWMWQVNQLWFGPQIAIVILFFIYGWWNERKMSKATKT